MPRNATPMRDGGASLRALFLRPGRVRRVGGEMAAAAGPRAANRSSERAESMRRVNPAFIPRNHRIEQVISAAVEREDFAPFEEMLRSAVAALRGSSAFAKPTQLRRSPTSGCCRPSAEPERVSE